MTSIDCQELWGLICLWTRTDRMCLLSWEQLVTLLPHHEFVIEMDESIDVVTLYSYHKWACLAIVSVPLFQRWGSWGLAKVKWLEGDEFGHICVASSITVWGSHFNNVDCENERTSFQAQRTMEVKWSSSMSRCHGEQIASKYFHLLFYKREIFTIMKAKAGLKIYGVSWSLKCFAVFFNVRSIHPSTWWGLNKHWVPLVILWFMTYWHKAYKKNPC